MLSERSALIVALAAAVHVASACDKKDEAPDPAPSASSSGPAVSAPLNASKLTPELAAKVLAKVGDRTITLGDYAAALDRMDRFERLRYQTPERRRLLLDEMINVELLAREAERRGLQDDPVLQAQVRMVLRQQMTDQLRSRLPSLEELPMAELRAYYDAHRADYADPERRRVSVIRMSDRAKAAAVLEQAKGADAKAWGELARKHSNLDPSAAKGPTKDQARPPLELEGDLGLVSGPGETKGGNRAVPEAVRRAVFEISEQGGVHGEVVGGAGAWYIVRLVGRSPARQRSFEEAEQTLRARLLQQKLRDAEARLISELQKESKVVINDAALSKLAVPAGSAP